ncbi:MAG: ion transporter [Planctomycetota bacterium]|nr:ion transporter [Planctomycetota bacterium]
MDLKERIDRIMRHPRTDLLIIGLICVSVALLVAEIGIDPSGRATTYLHVAGDVITGLFAFELLLRFYTAPRKNRFFRNYWVDIVAVLPLMRPLRFLRIVRLIRLHRVGILIHRRLMASSPTLAAGFGMQLMIFLTIGIVILVGGIAIHSFERDLPNGNFKSLGDALWWSFFTLVSLQPTLGEPKTEIGKVIMAFVVMGGLATVAVFTGVMSAVMIQRLKSGLEVTDVELDELRGHIVMCGWNRAAHLILQELQTDRGGRGQEVVVIAEFEELPEQELGKVDRTRVFFHKGDYTNMDVLERAGIRHASHAILLADKCKPRSDQDRDARTVLAALTIEKLNPKVFTCAQLLDRRNNVQLQSAGVENVVIDDEVSGSLIATSVRNRGLIGVITELLDVNVGNNLYKVPLPDNWAGRSCGEASRRLKDEHNAMLVALERKTDGRRKEDLRCETIVNPESALALEPGDELVLIARKPPALS